LGSLALDEADNGDDDDKEMTPTPATMPKAVSATLKRKTLAESVADIASSERTNR
jgi:hypothetical protein